MGKHWRFLYLKGAMVNGTWRGFRDYWMSWLLFSYDETTRTFSFFLWSDHLKGLSKQCQRSSDFLSLNALAFFYSFVKPIAYVSFSLPSSLRLLDFTDNRIFCLHSINFVRSRSGGSHLIHGGEHWVTSAGAAAKETCTIYTEVSTLGSGL